MAIEKASRAERVDRVSRDEKLPTLKLTVVQYGILLMMLVLVGGLWRLQVLGESELEGAGGAESNPQGSGAGAARQACLIAKGDCWSITIRRFRAFCCVNKAEISTLTCR